MPLQYAVLFGAGVLAGGLNAVAGGGSLVTFPTMVAMGIPSVAANATNAVGVWPGSLSSTVAFRDELKTVRPQVQRLLIPTIIGALIGAALLLGTGEPIFRIVVPVLIFMAALLLALQDRVKAWVLRSGVGPNPTMGWLFQLVISIYGGYFGAGMGVMMLASLSLFIDHDIHHLNAAKSWLSVAINLAATGIFAWRGVVHWDACLAVMGGAIVGGFVFARLSRKMNPRLMRYLIVAHGFIMSAWFTWKAIHP